MSDQPRNDGGQAFPSPMKFFDSHWPGQSLRDDFAGRALIGLLAMNGLRSIVAEKVAESAYQVADAMLVAREK